jgi:hypothetical protein
MSETCILSIASTPGVCLVRYDFGTKLEAVPDILKDVEAVLTAVELTPHVKEAV